VTGINRVILVGNVVRDLDAPRYTGGGAAVVDFSVAVNGREKIGEEWKDRADFFDVTAFGHTAEACSQYIGKGSPVAVDGQLRQERWTDRETGQNRTRVKIVASSVQFLSSGGGESDGESAEDVDDAGQPFWT
jgi:single-strand DNA-binding protein